jgi:hypothetical protein
LNCISMRIRTKPRKKSYFFKCMVRYRICVDLKTEVKKIGSGSEFERIILKFFSSEAFRNFFMYMHSLTYVHSSVLFCDLLVRIRIRGSVPLTNGFRIRLLILLFSSVPLKTLTKNNVFYFFCFLLF